MARAATKTLLSLDRFFAICGIHPLHANQVEVADLAPALVCDMPLLQYSWQYADRMGREEIAQAIADAEATIKLHCGFSVLRDWEVDERASFTRPLWPELYNSSGLNVRGQKVSIQTRWGYLISGGIETKTLVEANSPIVYTDPDGDGYSETATITAATTLTEIDEIAIYYPGKSGATEWEIRPTSVSIAGGIATIVCRREQLVLEALQEAFNARAVNGLDNANFLTLVDVYRHYNDPSQQVQFMWEGCECDGSGCAACSHSTQYGCLLIRDPKLGFFVPSPATWDATDLVWDTNEFSIARLPDQARLWYYAGNVNNISEWERAITYLALSMLDRPLCACRPLESFVAHWKEDLAYRQSSQSQSSSFLVGRRVLDNPIGTTRGAIHAWRLITRSRILENS